MKPTPTGDRPAVIDGERQATADSLSEAIYAALVADDPEAHIGAYESDGRTVIDGHFDLLRVSQRVMTRLAHLR